MEEVGGGQVGPFEDLEVIRMEAGMSTARFVKLIDMPERTWRRWQAKPVRIAVRRGLGRSRLVGLRGIWWWGMRWPNRRGGIARSGR